MANNEHIQSIASEFSWDEQKLLNKMAGEWIPNFKPSEEFKSKLDSKLQDKIALTQHQRQEQAELDAVPKRLKWRFYLTWYGYAVVSFLVLFLIWFCTNIFTWTLKVPTKYTYLEENKAFGELAYHYDINRASNFSYDGIDVDDTYVEGVENEEAAELIYNTNNSLEAKAKAMWRNIAITESYMTTNDELDEQAFNKYWDYLLSDWFMYNETYRFTYKDKLFPKLNSQYPVYKSNWILMWSNTPNQVLKNLKIWNVSFKNFQDLDIMNLEMEQSVENGYNIIFDNRNSKLYFYPNSLWKASEYLGKLPSNKQVIKNVEKDLKNLWVSLKNYWEWVIKLEEFDENMWILQVFYPFLINWKTVRNGESDQQIWMQIAYDLNLQKVVSVIWIDIATYDVSNYPTLEKKIIESEIEKWWEYYNQWALHENSTVVLFDWMEVVYTEKIIDWEIMYVPAIRSTVSTSIENYMGTSTVYEEIV